MPVTLLALFALLPILAALVLMVFMRWPAVRAMPVAWGITALLALLVWKLPALYVIALTLAGFVDALGILIIIFGALLILYTMQYSGATATIQAGFKTITPDHRIQALIIGFVFVSFTEGAAGFGTPAALAAPLMLSLGFPALPAVILALAFDSISVPFGAVGTPVLIGISLEANHAAAMASGLSPFASYEEFQRALTTVIAGLNFPVTFILPLFVMAMITKIFGPNKSFKDGLAIWKFAMIMALAFGLPYLLLGIFVGPEFPSLMGGLIGLPIVMIAAKKGWGVPKQVWTFGEPANWEKSWMGTVKPSSVQAEANMGQIRAWMPYILIGAILMITRINIFPFKAWLAGVVIPFNNILGFPTVDTGIKILYLPGTIPFMLVAIITVFIHQMSGANMAAAWKEAIIKIKAPTIALFFAVALVAIFKGSGIADATLNPNEYLSMPLSIAATVSGILGGQWLYLGSLIGGLGAFITGSATVSNLLFSDFQWGVAESAGLSYLLVLGAQVSGAAFGNMVCILNVVAASATVGLGGREGVIMKYTFVPFVLYAVLIGIFVLIANMLFTLF